MTHVWIDQALFALVSVSLPANRRSRPELTSGPRACANSHFASVR